MHHTRRRNFLVDAPRIIPTDLDIAVSDQDELIVDEMEDAWYDFLESNPSVLPTGTKGSHVEELEDQLEEIHFAKENVASELNRQLAFFSNSKDQLETNFKKAMGNEAANQQRSFRAWNHQLENVEVANQLFNETLPWENFFGNLDLLATEIETDSISFPSEKSRTTAGSQSTSSSAMKPSKRALTLVQKSTSDKLYPSKDLQLRAYCVDHALLTAEVKMLQNEIKRQEKTTESLEVLDKFLLEHNIWGLLTTKPKANLGGSAFAPSVSGSSTAKLTATTNTSTANSARVSLEP